MSSTDEDNANIERVFDQAIGPAAAALRTRNGRYFELAPSATDASYFTARTRRSLAPRDFEWPVVASEQELTERLRELWVDQPELTQLIAPLVKLARKPDNSDEGDGAVPEHVYTMY